MTYNIHPIIVHFPVALLFVYSVIKILPFRKWLPNFAWKDVEVVLLIFGLLGAFASISTGEIAEELSNPSGKLVETHAFFATLSTWLFGLLLAGEVLAYVNTKVFSRPDFAKYQKWPSLVERILTHKVFSKVLALLGLMAITLTGMLGGIMVYGLSADPLAPMVLKLLGL